MTTRRPLADITEFVRHLHACASYRCASCGAGIHGGDGVHYVGTVDSHPYVVQSCDCGADDVIEIWQSVVGRSISKWGKGAK